MIIYLIHDLIADDKTNCMCFHNMISLKQDGSVGDQISAPVLAPLSNLNIFNVNGSYCTTSECNLFAYNSKCLLAPAPLYFILYTCIFGIIKQQTIWLLKVCQVKSNMVSNVHILPTPCWRLACACVHLTKVVFFPLHYLVWKKLKFEIWK